MWRLMRNTTKCSKLLEFMNKLEIKETLNTAYIYHKVLENVYLKNQFGTLIQGNCKCNMQS